MLRKALNFINNYQSLIVLVILWELVVYMQLLPERLFPSLWKVLQVAVDLVASSLFWDNLVVTMHRVLSGFVLAALIGVPLGLIMSRYKWFDDLMQPIFSIGYPIPRVALYPVFVFILGIGSSSKIALIFLECIFPIVINTYYGSKRTPHLYIWAAKNMGASDWQLFWKVLFPATIPSIFTGFRTALPVAFVIGVLTEMISSTDGMGYLLNYMSASLQQVNVLAAVLLIGIVGYLLDFLIKGIRQRFVYWN